MSKLWPRLVHPDRRADEALREIVARHDAGNGARGYIRQQRAIMGGPIRALLPGIEIPTLMLVGEGDAITPPEIAREMAEMIEWAP